MCSKGYKRQKKRGKWGGRRRRPKNRVFLKLVTSVFSRAGGGGKGEGRKWEHDPRQLNPFLLPLSSAFISKVVSKERKNMREEKRKSRETRGARMSALSFAWCEILFFWTLCHDCNSVTYRYRIIALGAASKPFFPSPRVLGPLLHIPTPKRRRIHTHIAPRINGRRLLYTAYRWLRTGPFQGRQKKSSLRSFLRVRKRNGGGGCNLFALVARVSSDKFSPIFLPWSMHQNCLHQ